MQKRILSFKVITDHKGDTIAGQLIDCLEEWGIEKIFTITVDNARENDKALKGLIHYMWMKAPQSLVFDGDYLHMRCCAHILNLIVGDGLKKARASIVDIRNAFKYVRSSFTRLMSFQLRCDRGKVSRGTLPLDCVTKWNLTYLMLTAAIKLRVAFERMSSEDKLYCDYFLEEDEKTKLKRVGPPNSECWDEVQRSDEEVRKHAAVMRDKFEKYWDGFGNMNPLVKIASVFDPTNKLQFAILCFEAVYGKESAEPSSILDLSDDEDGCERMDSIYNKMVNLRRGEDSCSELDIYLAEKTETRVDNKLGLHYDVLSWWNKNSNKFPSLSEMARDVLAVQISSVASESAFSTSGRVLDPYRSSLTPYMVEVLIFTQQWLRCAYRSQAQVANLVEMLEEILGIQLYLLSDSSGGRRLVSEAFFVWIQPLDKLLPFVLFGAECGL